MKHIPYILLGGLLLLLAAACEKDTEATSFAPQVTTGTATDIYRKGATLSGSIAKTDVTLLNRYGILFSNLQSMAECQELNITTGESDFTVQVQNLEPGETYYFCTYANSGHSTVRGEVRSFTTTQSNAPVLGELQLVEATETSITLTTTILDDGGSEIIMSGFCYAEGAGKEPTPFVDMTKNISVTDGNLLSVTISGLIPEKSYRVRGYAATEHGVGYSETLVINTQSAALPVVSNITCKESTPTSITVAASIAYAGSAAVTEAGFCYSTTQQQPTIKDSRISLGATNDDFSTLIDGLTTGTTYYIRAYAENAYGISYSETYVYTPANPEEEKPDTPATPPTLGSVEATASSPTSITLRATLTDAGSATLAEVGFCYSTTQQQPDMSNATLFRIDPQGVENGTFSALLESLSPGTTYYIRAYATSDAGTGYSTSCTCTTPAQSSEEDKDAAPGTPTINDMPLWDWQ